MRNDPLFHIAAAVALAVLAVLLVGIVTFSRGGAFNRRQANRLMRWRIVLQALAVALIVALAWLGQRG